VASAPVTLEAATPRSGDDDATLVAAARGGDRESFNELYRRHAGLVRGVLLARSHYVDVPDLLQDVFVTAWTRLATLRDGQAFASWVVTIARNHALSKVRQRVTFAELTDVPDTSTPPDETFELLEMISTLPIAYRETLLLRFVEGMTGPEIARRTGLAEGSVRVNLHRGMQLLRSQINRTGRNRKPS